MEGAGRRNENQLEEGPPFLLAWVSGSPIVNGFSRFLGVGACREPSSGDDVMCEMGRPPLLPWRMGTHGDHPSTPRGTRRGGVWAWVTGGETQAHVSLA